MAKSSEPTPVMKQYQEAKAAAPGALLLFRMGDFYELFFDDAYKAADALGIAVTSRDRNKGPEATPMAGFPHHQLDIYLARLIAAGYKVAVCEQTEDPKKAKKIVRRELVRIVTPGTVTDDAILDPKTSNFLAAVAFGTKVRFLSGPNDLALAPSTVEKAVEKIENIEKAGINPKKQPKNGDNGPLGQDSVNTQTVPAHHAAIDPREPVGLAWAELSTGEFVAGTVPFGELFDHLARIHPSEILISESAAEFFPNERLASFSAMRTTRPDWTFRIKTAQEALLRQLKVKTLTGFGFDEEADRLALEAAGSALDYLRETQKQSLEHLDSLTKYRNGSRLEIDQATIRSLEVLQTTGGRRDGSLLSILDRCVTPMGSRLLTEWVVYPLTKIDQIDERLDAVEELFGDESARGEIRLRLRRVHDLARIMTRVIQERVTPRELAAVAGTLAEFPYFKEETARRSAAAFHEISERIFPLDELAAELNRALGDDPPLVWRDGGFIRPGYNAELDECRALGHGGKKWLASYQQAEQHRTGISTLKVGFNSVFGYYIEVTRTNADKVPDGYIRKQTLKNAERYITEELKTYEEKVLNAEETAKKIEFEILAKLRAQTSEARLRIQRSAAALARLDALANLAQIAADRGYRRPTVVEEPVLHIRDGRHPVLEVTEPAGTFTPNDADCSPDSAMIHLITGPNMAGKSTYIRQVALLTLMAQIGSFLPVSEARIGRADRIFARVGASDELTRGLSTFMVEMIETARILNSATENSLVVLDEIGRGTSTYDGISLAWAIAESLRETIGCRTFFATHYHELTELAASHTGIDNLNVAVREWDDEIAFLHKIVPGPADKSYGIHVARLAGVPKGVIRRAKRILEELESSHMDLARQAVGDLLRQVGSTPFDGSDVGASRTAAPGVQFSLFGPDDHPVIEELRELDLNALTPLEALALLDRWKRSIQTADKKARKRK